MDPIPLDAKSLNLGRLLSSSELKVPDFQRPYKWGEEQIKDFWDDIVDAARRRAPHFFGTLLTAPGSEHPTDGSVLDVLDGQQRLTTFTLLLIALDRCLEEMEAPDASKRVREGAAEARRRIAEALTTPRGIRRLRLRSDDDPLLGNLIAGNPGAGTVGRAFTTLHEHLANELDKSDDRFTTASGLASAVLEDSVVIHANCRASFDPFVVFSTLNATGLPLTATQILRARNLGLVQKDAQRVQSATIQAWDNVERLDDDSDRFLQTMLVLASGERVQAKDVVRRFDRDILQTRDIPSDPANREEHFLRLAASIRSLTLPYASLAKGKWPLGVPVSDEWHESRIRLLVKNLGIRQLLPLLVSAAVRCPTEFQAIVGTLERAAFMALACLDNQTQWGDTTFSLARDVYIDGAGHDQITAGIRRFFVDRLGDPREALRRRLPDQLYYQGNRRTRIRYFLTTVNDWGFPSESPTDRPDVQALWNLSDIHLDHIAPKNGPSNVPPGDRDRIGNLTPLKGRINSSLANSPFPNKRAGYATSPLRITRELAVLQDWGIDEVERREADLVEFAVQLFCRGLDMPPEPDSLGQ